MLNCISNWGNVWNRLRARVLQSICVSLLGVPRCKRRPMVCIASRISHILAQMCEYVWNLMYIARIRMDLYFIIRGKGLIDSHSLNICTENFTHTKLFRMFFSGEIELLLYVKLYYWAIQLALARFFNQTFNSLCRACNQWEWYL